VLEIVLHLFRYFRMHPQRLGAFLGASKRSFGGTDARKLLAGGRDHANVHNHFNFDRHLTDRQTYKTGRSAALAEWQNLMA
jgi:hypothetical protein